MRTPLRPSLSSLRLSVLALSLMSGGAVWAQAPVTPDPQAVRRLASDDPQVQASRWGTLALMAGKPWLTQVPGEIATVWRLASWVVPGASMRFQRGFCAATACQATDYVVQFDDKAGQLQFFEDGAMAYTGHVEADGALRMKGTGLLGVLTAETLRHDPATGTLYANAHQLKAGTAQQLASATNGFAPATAAAAHLSAPPSAAAPAPAPAGDDLRAELESMKAKVEQLSRQLEQQTAPAPAPARPLTPAEARAKAAEEKRQAESRAREEKLAKAAEAQRLAAERKARAEQEKREQAEAKAREAEARAAEARRQAEERRAQEEAARRQAEEQRARQETERREAAERAREAEAARVRAAQEAAARQQAAAQPSPPPRPAVAEGPIRPGLYSSGTGYEVDVKLVGDALVLTERAYNRTSEYRPTSPGSRVYGYRNPNTGTHFALTVQDRTTLVASRFSGSGEVLPNGTPLRFAGGAAQPQPVSSSTFAAMEARAQHYLRLAQTDPTNAQAWSFCGMAAMAQAHGQNEAQVRQAAMALKSIATTSRSPCGEVISDSLWNSLP